MSDSKDLKMTKPISTIDSPKQTSGSMPPTKTAQEILTSNTPPQKLAVNSVTSAGS